MPRTRTRTLVAYMTVGFVAVTAVAGVFWSSHASRIRDQIRIQMTEVLALLDDQIDPALRSASTDLLLAGLHPSVARYVESGDPGAKVEVADYFKFIALHDRDLAQIRLIDADGFEQVRIERVDGVVRVVPETQLQDKSHRDYILATSSLPPNSLYMSKADLNREHNQIEIPLNPVLRLSLPLYKRDGVYMGALVSNLRLANIFSLIEYSDRAPGVLMTLNKQGYWLKAPDSGKQWGHVLGHEARFQNFYPKIWQSIQATNRGAVIETDEGIFGFRQYYPVAGLQMDSQRSVGILGGPDQPLDPDSLRWTFLFYRAPDSLPSPWRRDVLDLWMIYGVALVLTLLASVQGARMVDARRQAVRNLEREERRYRGLVQSTSQIVWTANAQGEILQPTESWMAFTGQSADQVRHYGWLEAVHPDDREHAMESTRRTVETEDRLNLEYRLRRHDGAWRIMDVRGTRVHDDTGKLLEWVGMSTDVTERRKMEAELARHESRYRALLEATTNVIWTNDAYGSGNEAAESWLNFTGQSRADVANFGWLEAVHPDDRDRVIAVANQAFRDKSTMEIDYRLRRADGEWRMMEVKGIPVLDGNGMISEWVGMGIDVTDRREAEAGLELFKRMIEASTDPFYVINLETPGGRFVYVNRAAEQHWGRGRDELLRLGLADIDADITSDHVARIIEESRDKPNRRFEAVHRRADGTEVPVIVSASRIEWEGQTHTYGYVRDISAIKENEAALRAAKEQAEQASRAKSEFLSAMSHELRTPLNAILGFAQLLQMEHEGEGDTRLNMEVAHILEAGNHLLGLVDEVLDLARIETETFSITLDAVDPHQIIQSSLASVDRMRSEKSLTVDDGTRDKTLPMVMADPTRARQMLLNLLSNAVKYNRAGGWIALRADVTEDGFLRFQVDDGGIGIASDKQARLFIPFDRLGHENSAIEGTGIGLVICRRLVEEMGGRMGFHSMENEGSSFWFELPVLDSNRAVASRPLANAPAYRKTASTPKPQVNAQRRILYVEDNPSNIQVVERILAGHPEFSLSIAQSAEDAFDLLERDPPHLILMDINLPGMNGFEAVRRIKSDPRLRSLPVVAVSARAMQSDITAGSEAGFDAYVTKPFDIEDLMDAVQSALDPAPTQGALD